MLSPLSQLIGFRVIRESRCLQGRNRPLFIAAAHDITLAVRTTNSPHQMPPKKLAHIFDGTIKLPTPSRVALEILRLCYSDDSSLQDIAAVVEVDPALSAELLKYANSALMTSPMQVASVQRAAVKIGTKGVVNLALGFSMLSQYQQGSCEKFDYNRYWCHCLAQAVAARSLARANHGIDPDEAFTCGLLSNIGELSLATAYPSEYSSLLARALDRQALLDAEKTLCSLDRHELTTALLLDWGIPERLATAAGIYATPQGSSALDEETRRLADLFYLAGRMADTYAADFPLPFPLENLERQAERFNIPQETFSAFFDTFLDDLQAWGGLLRIPTRYCPGYQEIKDLDQATEKETTITERSDILILAVDDDPLTLLNLDRMLSSSERRLITVDRAEDALQVALEELPDILITDWRMADGMDGLELCKQIRRIAVTRHMYIIMLTGVEEEDELLRAFDAGADDYVVKPFIPKILEARIRSGERMIRSQRTINKDRKVIQQYASKLAELNHKLETMAMTDALTSLPNRRSAMARMKDMVAECLRFNEQLSCILIDIDHFKKINDTYGHDDGDIVLKEISALFAQKARSYDMVSRIGGEEFLIISTRSGPQESLLLAERLRKDVEQFTISLAGGATIQITISLGVATRKKGFKDVSELIKPADRALYMAKHKGRNRVEAEWEIA